MHAVAIAHVDRKRRLAVGGRGDQLEAAGFGEDPGPEEAPDQLTADRLGRLAELVLSGGRLLQPLPGALPGGRPERAAATKPPAAPRPAALPGPPPGAQAGRQGLAAAVLQRAQGAHVVGVARDRAALEELRAQLGGTFIPVAADATDPVVAGQLLDQYRPRTLVLNAGASPLSRPLHRHTWQTFSRNWDVDVQHVFNWTREALLLPLEPGSVVIAISSGAAVNGSPVSGGYAGAKAPEQVGTAITDIATDSGDDRNAYLLTAAGLSPAP